MRWLFALLALVAAPILGFSTAARAHDWHKQVAQAPDGAFVIGNPAAKVKLVEYLSYTCPHCAAFWRESASVLRGQMVKSGSTSIEVRNLVRDPLDLDAAMLARCAGPAGFDRLSNAFFVEQDQWLEQGMRWQQANAERIRMYSQMARLKASADGAGLTAIARAQGMTDAQVTACFASDKALQPILAMTGHVPAQITGTPGFLINGKVQVKVYTWSALEPKLRAQGAR